MALKNNINTYADMTAYNADSTKEYPNVSYVIATDEVVWAKDDPADLRRVFCTYNVTSTSSATKLLGSKTSISKQIIDGVEQSSVVTEYTFDTTGEHLVKYEFKNNQIGISAFQNCSNLTSINIPNNITTIGNSAFYQCSGLTSITIPDGVTSIGGSAFSDCTNLTSINIPNSVTSIGSFAFYRCSSLESITIPNTVTNIGDYAFYQCSGLTSVTIPNTVTSIGNKAFTDCDSLTSITIPDSVTSIGKDAFFSCTNLASVTVKATTPPSLGSNAFANNASGRKIYVPSASVNTYKTATNWSTYASAIVAIQNS